MVAQEPGMASTRRGRPGPDFVKLWLAQGVSNLGDGVYLTALPLLVATPTRDPLPVSAVMFAEWLPWLLFGLLAGALLDRWERRRVMWMVDAARLVVVGSFAAAVLAGWASIPLLMATGFLLGTGQTLVDTASQALIPALVSRDPGAGWSGPTAGWPAPGWSPSSSPARRPAGSCSRHRPGSRSPSTRSRSRPARP
jgi:MFS family permease